MKTHAVFVHGFLGQPFFWDATIDALSIPGLQTHAPALFGPYSLQGFHSIEEWVENFYRYSLQISKSPLHLVGYSMGGRLLLDFTHRHPDRVKSLCLVSARPGLLPEENFVKRRKWELAWAEKVLDLSWEMFLQEWGQQEIFAGGPELELKESEGLREELSLALVNWSITQSSFSWSDLENLKVPNFWVVGDRDRKYLQVEGLIRAQAGASVTQVILGAGHRVPVEQPVLLAKALTKWFHRSGG